MAKIYPSDEFIQALDHEHEIWLKEKARLIQAFEEEMHGKVIPKDQAYKVVSGFVFDYTRNLEKELSYLKNQKSIDGDVINDLLSKVRGEFNGEYANR